MSDAGPAEVTELLAKLFGGSIILAMFLAAIVAVVQATEWDAHHDVRSTTPAERAEAAESDEERTARLEAEREASRNTHLEVVKRALTEAEEWTYSGIGTDSPMESDAVKKFQYWANTISTANTLDLGEHTDVAALRSIAVKHQREVLPKLRDAYGPWARKQLWIDDMSAKTYGSGFRTVQFVSWQFAANRNIQEFHEIVRPVLRELRFKKAAYKWTESTKKWTSYTVDSPDDDEVVVYRSGVPYPVH